MGEVAGDVGEGEVFGAHELDGGTFEQGIVLFADVSGVFCLSAERPHTNREYGPMASWQMS